MIARVCRACGAELAPRSVPRGRPRKWCSERCRKSQYDRACVDCGARIGGTDPAKPSLRCRSCQDRHQHDARHWTQAAVLAAIRAYAQRHGRPPAGNPKRPTPPGMPPVKTVQREFGSWSAAIRAAGLTPLRPGRKRVEAGP